MKKIQIKTSLIELISLINDELSGISFDKSCYSRDELVAFIVKDLLNNYSSG